MEELEQHSAEGEGQLVDYLAGQVELVEELSRLVGPGPGLFALH